MINYKLNPGQEKIKDVLTRDDITRVLVYSGSRAGKTFEFVRSIVSRALLAPQSRHAIIRKHFSSVKKYIWLDTLPDVITKCFPEIEKEININKTDYFYKFPNGAEIWIGGLDDKERADKILGGEYNTVYFNECSEVSWSSVQTALTRLARKTEKVKNGESIGRLINKAYFDCNPPAKSHWSYRLFFEHVDPETRVELPNPETYQAVHIKPADNVENLTSEYIEFLKTLTGDKRKRFYEGMFQDEIKGALWNQAMINKLRVKSYPELYRVVVAIDPAVTSGEKSNETGIVIIGMGFDGHLYVLDDITDYYTPNGWASAAILAYDKWEADAIIGEVNNGGDLVESNVLNQRPDAGFRQVRASRGKIVRAEPIASLYERGIAHHVGEFVDLEYQMTTYTGSRGEDSPDRFDALVWGAKALTDGEEPEDDYIVHDERVNISNI